MLELSSCQENNRNTDENGEKIENVGGTKTSVVFRTNQNNDRHSSSNHVLLENGDILRQNIRDDTDGSFLEIGDTVTYKGNDVKAVRYKDGTGKNVNFGKIGKIGKDITD